MKTVVATGVFEILHLGHILFLREAKKLGDRLVVIVARDKTVETRKRKPIIPEKQRLGVVRTVRWVDDAILGDEKDFMKPIKKINPDIIALGKDQRFDEKKLREELRSAGLKTKVVRIKNYWYNEFDSSNKIIKLIKKSG